MFQAVQAIRHPGRSSPPGRAFKYIRSTGFLELRLPSGRALSYPRAELIEDEQYGTTSLHLPRRQRQQESAACTTNGAAAACSVA